MIPAIRFQKITIGMLTPLFKKKIFRGGFTIRQPTLMDTGTAQFTTPSLALGRLTCQKHQFCRSSHPFQPFTIDSPH